MIVIELDSNPIISKNYIDIYYNTRAAEVYKLIQKVTPEMINDYVNISNN